MTVAVITNASVSLKLAAWHPYTGGTHKTVYSYTIITCVEETSLKQDGTKTRWQVTVFSMCMSVCMSAHVCMSECVYMYVRDVKVCL